MLSLIKNKSRCLTIITYNKIADKTIQLLIIRGQYSFNVNTNLFTVIPQSCRYRGVKYECGLSISCVLGGGRPLDLCSGGMIWACCVDRDNSDNSHSSSTPTQQSDVGVLHNASKCLSKSQNLINWGFNN